MFKLLTAYLRTVPLTTGKIFYSSNASIQSMDEKPCEYCHERKAVTQCEVCGSMVCTTCKLEHGCKACDGGEMKF